MLYQLLKNVKHMHLYLDIYILTGTPEGGIS